MRAGETVDVRNTPVDASQTLVPLLFDALGTALGMVVVFWAMSLLLGIGGWSAARRWQAQPFATAQRRIR